jgi:2-(1,2-epoxy-1,2-dihydrophenyl)acetyl-CoA isomerase
MDYKTILLDIAGGAARLTLNRPDRLNSFNVEMHDEVAHALGRVEASGARVLLLTGAGRGFCAGQDLSDSSVMPGDERLDLGETLEVRYNPLVRRLASLPAPVICAVNGVAAGAGANIAFACDIVLAARSAKFIQSFANIGLIPDSGGTWSLPRLAGQARALGMALAAEPVSAEKAEGWGPDLEVRRRRQADGRGERARRQVRRRADGGLAATKKLIRESGRHTFEQQLDLERDTQRRLGHTHDYAEGVTAFMQKRPPKFTETEHDSDHAAELRRGADGSQVPAASPSCARPSAATSSRWLPRRGSTSRPCSSSRATRAGRRCAGSPSTIAPRC